MGSLSWDDSCLLPRPGSSSQPSRCGTIPPKLLWEVLWHSADTPSGVADKCPPPPGTLCRGKVGSQGPAITHGGAPLLPWFHLAPSCLQQAAARSTQHRTQVRAAENQRGFITALDEMPPSQRLQAGSAPRQRRPSLPSFCSTSLRTSDLPSAFPSGWKASAKTPSAPAHCSLSGDRKGDCSSSMSFDQQQQLSWSSQQTSLNLPGRNWIRCPPPTLMHKKWDQTADRSPCPWTHRCLKNQGFYY